MHKTRLSTMINAQSNARHPLFEIQNKLGTMMPWMTSVAFRNSETCIFVRLLSKQCHDMLHFKTKLNGTKLNGTMIPVVFFCPLLMDFNENITYIFFSAIHHIDPLHRKQTLTLSQCNSRDLTDSPYRNLEKCKQC